MRGDGQYQLDVDVQSREAAQRLEQLVVLLQQLVNNPVVQQQEVHAVQQYNQLLAQQSRQLEEILRLRNRLNNETLTPQQRGGVVTSLKRNVAGATMSGLAVEHQIAGLPGVIRDANTGNLRWIGGAGTVSYGGTGTFSTPRTPGVIADPYTSPAGVIETFSVLNRETTAQRRAAEADAAETARRAAREAQQRDREARQRQQAEAREAQARQRQEAIEAQAARDSARLHEIATMRGNGLFGFLGGFSARGGTTDEVRAIQRRAARNPGLYGTVSDEAYALLNRDRRNLNIERDRPGGVRSAVGGAIKGMNLPYTGLGVFGLSYAGTEIASASLHAFAELENQKKLLAGMVSTFNQFRDTSTGLPLNFEQNYQEANKYAGSLYKQIRSEAVRSPLTTKELFDSYTTGYSFLASKGLTSTQSLDIVSVLGSMGRMAGLRPESVRDDLRAISSGVYKNVQTFQMAGISPDEFRTMSKMSGQDFYKEFKTRFAGFDRALGDFEESLQSKMDRFVDNLYQLGQKLGEKFAPTIIDFIEDVNKRVDEWTRDGTLDKMVDKLKWVLDQIAGVATFVVNNFDKIFNGAAALGAARLVSGVTGAIGGVQLAGQGGMTIAQGLSGASTNFGQRIAATMAMNGWSGGDTTRLVAGGRAAEAVTMPGASGVFQGMGVGLGARGGLFGLGAGATGYGATVLGLGSAALIATGAYAGYDLYRGFSQINQGSEAHTWLGDTVGRGFARAFGGDFYGAGERDAELQFIASRFGTNISKRQSAQNALGVLPLLQGDSTYLRRMFTRFDLKSLPTGSFDDSTRDRLMKETDPDLAYFNTVLKKRGLLDSKYDISGLMSKERGEDENYFSQMDWFKKLGSPQSLQELTDAANGPDARFYSERTKQFIKEMRQAFMDKIQEALMRDVESVARELTTLAEPTSKRMNRQSITDVTFYQLPDLLRDQSAAMRGVSGVQDRLTLLGEKEGYLSDAIQTRLASGDYAGARALLAQRSTLLGSKYQATVAGINAQEALRQAQMPIPGQRGVIESTGAGTKRFSVISSVSSYLQSKGLAYDVQQLLSLEQIGDKYGVAQDTLLPMLAISGGFANGKPSNGLQGYAARARSLIEQQFGITNIGGVRQSARDLHGHPEGRALDVMVGKNTALGQQVADWALANAKELGLQYVIWQQKINSNDGRGWRQMDDRGSPTANHMDHPHLNFLPGGVAGIGASPAFMASATRQAQAAGLFQKQFTQYDLFVEANNAIIDRELQSKGLTPAERSAIEGRRASPMSGDTRRDLSIIAGIMSNKSGSGLQFLRKFMKDASKPGANPDALLEELLQGDLRGYVPEITRARTLRNIRSSLDLSPVQMQTQLANDYNEQVALRNNEVAAALSAGNARTRAGVEYRQGLYENNKALLTSFLSERSRNGQVSLLNAQTALESRISGAGMSTIDQIVARRKLELDSLYEETISGYGIMGLDGSGKLPTYEQLTKMQQTRLSKDPMYQARIGSIMAKYAGQKISYYRGMEALRYSSDRIYGGIPIAQGLANPYLSVEERLAMQQTQMTYDQSTEMGQKIREYRQQGMSIWEAIQRAQLDLGAGQAAARAGFDSNAMAARRELANSNALTNLNFRMSNIGAFGIDVALYRNQSQSNILQQLFTNPSMLKDTKGPLTNILGADQYDALNNAFMSGGESGLQSLIANLLVKLKENTDALTDSTSAIERRESYALSRNLNFAVAPTSGNVSSTGGLLGGLQDRLDQVDLMSDAEVKAAVPGASSVAAARTKLKSQIISGHMGDNRALYMRQFGMLEARDAFGQAVGDSIPELFTRGVGGFMGSLGSLAPKYNIYQSFAKATAGRGTIARLLGKDPSELTAREIADFKQAQYGEFGSGIANAAMPFINNAIYGSQPNYSGEGSQVGGFLASAGLFAGLGAWAGPVGIIAGGLLGGLFKKSSGPSQEDINRRRHEQAMERIGNETNKLLRPMNGYFTQFQGSILYGAASRYLSGRAVNSFGRQELAGMY